MMRTDSGCQVRPALEGMFFSLSLLAISLRDAPPMYQSSRSMAVNVTILNIANILRV